MHRPGIASIEGDLFVLDGTTIEEVEQHHVETLNLVVDRANAETRSIEQKEKSTSEREAAAAREHEANVTEVAKRITFD
jgi:sRNA-binding protein